MTTYQQVQVAREAPRSTLQARFSGVHSLVVVDPNLSLLTLLMGFVLCFVQRLVLALFCETQTPTL